MNVITLPTIRQYCHIIGVIHFSMFSPLCSEVGSGLLLSNLLFQSLLPLCLFLRCRLFAEPLEVLTADILDAVHDISLNAMFALPPINGRAVKPSLDVRHLADERAARIVCRYRGRLGYRVPPSSIAFMALNAWSVLVFRQLSEFIMTG